MTTRGRIARGEHQQEFEGHVQRWVKQWEPLGGTSKVKVLKYVPTGDRSEAPAASRVPHLKTVRDSSLKVVFRPKQAPRPPDQPEAAQDIPSSNGVARPEAEQPHHSSAQPDAAVPMEIETAKVEDAQEQSRTLEQQSMPMQASLPSKRAEEKQRREDALGELPASAASGPAHEPDRALAEQAASATLAALNDGPAAHQVTANTEHAAAPSLPMDAETPMAAQAADVTLPEAHADTAAPPVRSDAVITAQDGNATGMGSAGS